MRSELGPLVRRHALFLAFLALGVGLRIVTLLAYRPALFSPDSPGYVDAAERWILPSLHPLGYSLFLRSSFLVWDDFALVVLLQHVLGLAMAVLIYAVLVRLEVRAWLAALASAPVLLDAYQLNVEQYVLSDTLFEFAIVAGCAALLWRSPVTLPAAVLAGGLFAAAAMTRAVGLLVVIPVLVAVLVLRLRPVRAAALAAAFLLPVVAYASAFKVANGTFGLTDYSGRYLYGRVVEWVDCGEFSVPAHERPLCPGEYEELEWVYQYLWTQRSPLYDVELPSGESRNDVAGDFARRAVLGQPVTYVRNVVGDSLLTFSPTKHERTGEFRVSQWQFQTEFPIPNQQRGWTVEPPRGHVHGPTDGKVNEGAAELLKTYQRFGYVPGPILAACALIALAGALGLGRAKHAGLRAPTAVFLTLGFVLCVGSVASTMFAWRYQLPQLILLPPAAALAIESFLRRPSDRPAAAGLGRSSDREPSVS